MSEGDKSAVDEPIVFSHIEAYFAAAIQCPDCDLVLFAEPLVLTCHGCGAKFHRPKLTLERMPSEDYTHSGLASQPTETPP